jgi:predicted deacylase
MSWEALTHFIGSQEPLMTRLVKSIAWRHVPIHAGETVGPVELAIGEVGEGHPRALVTAGIHGDEGPWSAWAIHKTLGNENLEKLRGSLRIVPVANPLAMEVDARCSPLDGLDLNRAFPGKPDGSHTERLAAALTRHALEDVDVVIDLHGGGSWCVNAFAFQFPGGEPLARAFRPPFLVEAPERRNTLTGYARTLGADVAAVEMGGRSSREEAWAKRISKGLRRALGVAGVMTPAPSDSQPPEPVKVGPTKVLRPSRGGVFIPRLEADDVGTTVPGGTVLGRLHDPVTMQSMEAFEAPFPETALLLLRPTLAVIEGGAMTYVVAPPREEGEH